MEKVTDSSYVEGSFRASTRAEMAHAHILSTWFNVNGKRGSSHLLSPDRPESPRSHKKNCRFLKKRLEKVANLFP